MRLSSNPSLLIVDDDICFVRAAAELARAKHFDITVAGTVEQATQRMQQNSFDLALIDLSLPDGSGLDLIDRCDFSSTEIVIITGHPTVESAVRAIRMPMLDYLIKPLDPLEYQRLLERTAGKRPMPAISAESAWHGLVGNSAALRSIIQQIERVGPTDLNVLIQGESGVGKELVAQAIHATSGRSGAMVTLNCAAVAPELLASQLFGHERGSFTGAASRHIGYFEQAAGGTLFLDEVTEMPIHLQAHLLRALENRCIRRVGGSEDIPVDTRIVAATNRPMLQGDDASKLREDLYYRLGEFLITVPPLRERSGDIAALSGLFLARLNHRYGRSKSFTAGALSQLELFAWPGNIRELRNVISRAFLMATADHISDPLQGRRVVAPLQETPGTVTLGVGMTFDEMERRMLTKTLAYHRGDKTKTARVLGISVKTIYNRLARYGELQAGDSPLTDSTH